MDRTMVSGTIDRGSTPCGPTILEHSRLGRYGEFKPRFQPLSSSLFRANLRTFALKFGKDLVIPLPSRLSIHPSSGTAFVIKPRLKANKEIPDGFHLSQFLNGIMNALVS